MLSKSALKWLVSKPVLLCAFTPPTSIFYVLKSVQNEVVNSLVQRLGRGMRMRQRNNIECNVVYEIDILNAEEIMFIVLYVYITYRVTYQILFISGFEMSF